MTVSTLTTRLNRALLAGTVSLGSLLVATAAAAQEVAVADGDEILVTATKRSSTIQDVPFSINAQTERDIERSGAGNLEDLSRNVAGVSIQNLGPGQSQVSIRGVSAGQVVRDQPGVKEQVGVYLDESVISLSLFTPDLDLFDLNRVETLRGPQGTLFGSGSVGGTIRYITNQPSTAGVEGVVEANVNLVDAKEFGGSLKGAINLPVNDKVAVRAVGYYTEYGGYIDALRSNLTTDRNVNSGSRAGGRISVLLKPTEALTITPRIVYQEVRADGFNREEKFNLFANPFTTTRGRVTFPDRVQFLLLDESFSDDTFLADLTAELDLGSVAVTSVSSYIDRDILASRDASALTGSVSVDLGFPAAAVVLPSNLLDATSLKQFTQEVRLTSTGDGPFQWVIGGFYSDVNRDYSQRLPTPGYDAFTDARFGAGTSVGAANGFPLNSPYNADLPYDITQKAVFGEASYAVSDKLKVTAGGRLYDFKEARSFRSGGLFSNGDNRRDTTKSDGFTPRLLASFEASDNVTLNAQASKGFRLGGVNDPLNVPLCSVADRAIFGGFQDYDDETLWNYEGGIKARAKGVTFNAAAFYTDINNLQVTLDAGSCSSRVVFNAAKAHTAGIEAELTASPMKGLDLSLSGSVLKAEFDSTVRDGTGAVIGGIRDGNRLPSVPKFQFSASATYAQPFNSRGDQFVYNVSFQHVGNRFTQPSDQENNPRTFTSGLAFGGATGTGTTVLDLRLPSYNLVNYSIGAEFKSGIDVKFYVNNLFDEKTKLSFDRERGGRARLGFNVGQPRTYGLTVRKRF